LLFFTADDTGDAEGFRQALAAAERAIELAPQLPDGYVARALYHQYRGQDWSRAQADLEVALALAPDAPASQFLLGSLSWTLGRGPEALAAFERAAEADPLRGDAYAMCGSVLTALGHYEEARTAFARTLEISPRSVIALSELATLELVSGNAPAALATASRNEDEFWRLYATALAKHSLGDHEGSSAALAELIAKHADAGAYQIAVVHGWRGETDLAFEWLERARMQRDGGLGNLLLDPLLRSLHSDRRWLEFVQKMGLPLSPDPPASR
jgi:tetratricopeptide (TPR) repeat protein